MKPTLSSRQIFIVLIVLLTLALVACERPLNDEAEPTPTQETPVDTPPDAEAPPEGGTEGDAPPTLVPTQVPPGTGDETTPAEPAPEGGEEAAPPDEGAAEESPPPDQGGEAEQPPPVPEQPVAPPSGEQAHVVQAGENLFRIGLRYGCTVNELAAFNGIANPHYINVGQVILIPANCGG